jgi:predicted alpha/beta superfamily hydrolase
MPELERRYCVDRPRSALAGHSLSALGVVYAIFQDVPAFCRAIAGAPSLWWDDRSVLKHIAKFRETHAVLPAEIFLGVGEEETPSMLGDLALLEAQLQARPFIGLTARTQRFPGRTHYNLTPELFLTGLRALFGNS